MKPVIGLGQTAFHPAPAPGRAFYKVRRNGVLFTDATGPRLFLVANRHGERFFVSVHTIADGRLRYMFAVTTHDEREFPDLADYAYSKTLANRIWEKLKGDK
jgi:hypothetical protein